MNFTISARITLTEIRPEDQRDVLAHLQEHAVSRYTLLIPYPYTQAHAAEWLARVTAPGYNEPRTLWAIRNESQRMIGVAELAPEGPPCAHVAEVGYWLARPYWGQGIMTDVVKTLVEHAFRDSNIVRIYAPIFAANIGSARVLEKAGFSVEAPLMRKKYFRDGQFHDGRQYALVRGDEPRARPG
jgi:ribosomal-protein-alanine N-acetyltransferase